MIKWVLMIVLVLQCLLPVRAMDYTPPEVPLEAEKYMPEDTESFAQGLWEIIKNVISQLRPELAQAAGVCVSLIAILLLVSVIGSISPNAISPTELAAACMIGIILLRASDSMIRLGIETVQSLAQYSKLLLPVMTGAMAAQGGVTGSAALYTGTTIFISILTAVISKCIVPLLYIYLALSVAASAIRQELLKKLHGLCKWLMTWILKLSVYIFTAYIGITGVVGGTADAAAIKAAKLTMSGVVPVVGSMIADASDAVLASAGLMKNAAGIYGILATLSILAGPFLKVGVHYLLLKLTSGVCEIFSSGNCIGLLKSFCTAMGIVLGTIGAVSVMLLVSTVCFMKGVA